jgi:RND family efflux transporter MFP subunit
MAREYLLRTSWILFMLSNLVVAGCGGNAPADKTKEAPRVTVAHPSIRSLVDEDDYTGWLEAFKTVEVRSRVRGHITKVHFNDGDLVKEGQPLFDLDTGPFEVDLRQTEATKRALEAQKVAASRDAERYGILVKQKAASQQEYEKAVADAESFEAQIAAKKAEADRHRLDLKYAKITADLTGKIGKANLTEGNLVNAGGSDPLLTTIVAVDPIYVDFNVDERAIQRYQAAGSGQQGKDKQQSLREQKLPFAFGLDTEKGFPHSAELVFADNKYNAGTGTVLVRGVAKNPDGRLVPGSRVRVRIPVSDKYEAAVVPDSAVLSDQDRKYLLVVGKENKVLNRVVTPGRLLDDGMRVILPAPGEEKAEGNKDWTKNWEKEWVITVGLQRARVNDPVQPLDSNGQPIGAAPATGQEAPTKP